MTYWHSTRYPNTIGYVSFNSRINSFNQIEAVFNYYAIRASFFFRLLKLLFQNIVSFSLRIRMVGNKKSGTKLEKYFTIQLFILRLILSNWYNRSKCDSLSNNSMWYFLLWTVHVNKYWILFYQVWRSPLSDLRMIRMFPNAESLNAEFSLS